MGRENTVIFRKDPDGEIVALWPHIAGDDHGRVQCYERIGQHGAADYGLVIRRTSPAMPDEYAELLAELTAIGYVVEPAKRR